MERRKRSIEGNEDNDGKGRKVIREDGRKGKWK